MVLENGINTGKPNEITLAYFLRIRIKRIRGQKSKGNGK